MTPVANLSHEGHDHAELAIRDAVLGLALRLADLLEGFQERESLCVCVSERNQLIALM